MKSCIFALLFFFTVSAFSQGNDSIYNLQQNRRINMKVYSKSATYHGYLTIFCGDLGFNNSHQSLISFLDEYMGMTEKSQDFDNGYITSVVSEKVSRGNPERLKILYKISDKEDGSGEYYIDKVTITGSFNSVVGLFIKYWVTKLQTKDLKHNEWVYNYQAPDRIGLFITPQKNAKIEITKMK